MQSAPAPAPRIRRDAPATERTRRRRRHSTPSYVRLYRTAAVVVAATWIPGLIGAWVFGWWGTTAGYLGISWLLPALLVGIATDRLVRHRGLPLHAVAGWVTGLAAGFVLLLGAAYIVGA